MTTTAGKVIATLARLHEQGGKPTPDPSLATREGSISFDLSFYILSMFIFLFYMFFLCT
jgi:hypothetical protein